MLAQGETLKTIAEVSAALAGFSALAGAFGGSSGRESARASFLRLHFVVFVALYLVLFALLPIVVADYGLSPTRVWQACSAIALVLNVVSAVPLVRDYAKAGLARGWLAYFVIYPLAVVLHTALILNTFSLMPEHAGSLYLTFLYAALVQAAAAFMWLIGSAFAPDDK